MFMLLFQHTLGRGRNKCFHQYTKQIIMLFSFESLLSDENHSAVSNEKCNLKTNFAGSSRGCIY